MLEDPTVTHIVFGDDDKSLEYPRSDSSANSTYSVTAEWFWASIQMDVRADEAIYHAKPVLITNFAVV